MTSGMSNGKRTFDIVLFGATGFTGKLVAEYFAKTCGPTVRWAIAGRNEAKLAEVRQDLARIDPKLADLPIRIADAFDPASLDALVPQARVIVSTAGPFAKYGRELVAACARHGTHYADITGEVQFVRQSIDENDALAKQNHARIVHSCGYDSIPFDLGVYMLWEYAHERGCDLRWAKGFAGKTKGGISGGTLSSMLMLMEEASKDARTRRLFLNPRALDPDPSTRRGSERDQRGVRFDEDIRRWTAPFVMAVYNTRVVRRSDALIGYGDDFRYDESMSMPEGPRGFTMGTAITAGLAGIMAASATSFGRSLIAKTPLAQSGTGPSERAREQGYFHAHFVGETSSCKIASGKNLRLEGKVSGQGDPGYAATARMLGQSALCLAQDEDVLPKRWGVLTPAAAMGMHLVERLRHAQFEFTVSAAPVS